VRIEGLVQPPYETTLLGVLKGALDHFGRDASPAWAFGVSGHAFLVNVHEQICPSGPYCWNHAPFWPRVADLGLQVEDLGFFHAGSRPEERAEVEQKVREHLDRGLPASLCNKEHQLIVGHDARGLLAAQPWTCGHEITHEITPATIAWGTWAELGEEIHASFFLHRPRPPADEATAIRGALAYAVDVFRRPERHSSPPYGAGPRAWETWARAVEAGHGASHGCWWNARVWSECRRMASGFLAEVAARRPEAAGRAKPLADDYGAIAEQVARAAEGEMPAPRKAALLREVARREEEAVRGIEDLLAALS
jgi:hypothetical protein